MWGGGQVQNDEEAVFDIFTLQQFYIPTWFNAVGLFMDSMNNTELIKRFRGSGAYLLLLLCFVSS